MIHKMQVKTVESKNKRQVTNDEAKYRMVPHRDLSYCRERLRSIEEAHAPYG